MGFVGGSWLACRGQLGRRTQPIDSIDRNRFAWPTASCYALAGRSSRDGWMRRTLTTRQQAESLGSRASGCMLWKACLVSIGNAEPSNRRRHCEQHWCLGSWFVRLLNDLIGWPRVSQEESPLLRGAM